ncbi:beta-catenin-like protein [Anaeramoeba ignava]|uniref:Beta-catenin-like protein n=1 Tax=Anaeramoeba ignava TaxID=1746090 RepID=A0A9Q0LK27_ANAIG|nr:beta-catenin-like protein [Anaeramoeba ignava]
MNQNTRKRTIEKNQKQDIDQIVSRVKFLPNLDSKFLKETLINLKKKWEYNQQQRIKFVEDPEKFMESESDLNTTIHELKLFAANPSMYEDILSFPNFIETVQNLISHENNDISQSILEALNEFIEEDADIEEDKENYTTKFAVTLLQNGILEIVVDNMFRLKNQNNDSSFDSENKSIFVSFNMIENFLEMDEKVTEFFNKKPEFFTFILDISQNAAQNFNANMEYASEILAILVQSNEKNQEILGKAENLDKLMHIINSFKAIKTTGDLDEFVQNIFDSLCSCLMNTKIQDQFRNLEGIELLLIMIKKNKQQFPSLKALDFAIMNNPESCKYFIEKALGLKIIFSLLMRQKLKSKKNAKKSKEKKENERKFDEFIFSILLSLMNQSAELNYARVVNKFIEKNHEKTEKMLDIFQKWNKKLIKGMILIQNEEDQNKIKKDLLDEITEEEKEYEKYTQKLNFGLLILQSISVIVLKLFVFSENSKIKILEILNRKKIEFNYIVNLVNEFFSNLDEESGDRKILEDLLILVRKSLN